jgi:cobalt-zinc-cadmium efflux system protein
MHHHHGHHHHHEFHAGMEGRLKLALAVTIAFVVLEGLAGFVAGSLALLSDAAHNLTDALALGVSWWAVTLARKPATAGKTFGYQRAGILAALLNASTLVVIAGVIFWEAFHRFRAPEPVAIGPMLLVAGVAIVVNSAIAWWLKDAAHGDVNARSAFIHMVTDALASVGVVFAALVIRWTDAFWVDPLVSVLIAALILWSSRSILSETVNVLLEGTPPGIEVETLAERVRSVPGVRDVHDVHVWALSSQMNALSCHLVVDDQAISSGMLVLREVNRLLEREFGIAHSTVQVEVEGCAPDDIYCALRTLSGCHDGHGSAASPDPVTAAPR